jgi:hypothetical protein
MFDHGQGKQESYAVQHLSDGRWAIGTRPEGLRSAMPLLSSRSPKPSMESVNIDVMRW